MAKGCPICLTSERSRHRRDNGHKVSCPDIDYAGVGIMGPGGYRFLEDVVNNDMDDHSAMIPRTRSLLKIPEVRRNFLDEQKRRNWRMNYPDPHELAEFNIHDPHARPMSDPNRIPDTYYGLARTKTTTVHGWHIPSRARDGAFWWYESNPVLSADCHPEDSWRYELHPWAWSSLMIDFDNNERVRMVAHMVKNEWNMKRRRSLEAYPQRARSRMSPRLRRHVDDAKSELLAFRLNYENDFRDMLARYPWNFHDESSDPDAGEGYDEYASSDSDATTTLWLGVLPDAQVDAILPSVESS